MAGYAGIRAGPARWRHQLLALWNRGSAGATTVRAIARAPAQLAGAALLLLVASGGPLACGSGTGSAGSIAEAIVRETNSVKLLTINFQGRTFNYGGKDVPWRERFMRPIGWMQQSKTWPDVIALQEMPLRKRWFLGGLDPADYEALFAMIAEARSRGGPEYRVAYATTAYVDEGSNPLYQGRAMLYNPTRLVNKSNANSNHLPTIPFDTTGTTGPVRRENHPCDQVAPQYASYCSLVDSTVVPWVGGYTDTTGRWHLGPTAALFDSAWDPGQYLAIYNVHLHTDAENFPMVMDDLKALVKETGIRWAARPLLYPPVVLGDFNIERVDMEREVLTGASFAAFQIAGGPAIEHNVIWALVGRADRNQTKFGATMTFSSESLPPGIDSLASGGICGDVDVAWTDHCSLYVKLDPGASAPQPSP